MNGTAVPFLDGAFLSTNDRSGCWTWAGARLSAEGRIEATQRFADLSWDERRKRLTEQDMAWLASQWDTPVPGSRFEVRFTTDARTKKVQAVFLVRVLAATQDEARRLARERLWRAAGPDGTLPPHVGARPIDSETELRTWLGYPTQIAAFVEVRKHLSADRIARGGTGLAYAVRHGFFDSGAAWDAWWRSFAELPFPAVLSIGFDPYDADNPAFRDMLYRRAADLEELASQGVPSPLNPYRVPPDRAAQAAVPCYRRALTRYAGRCFSVRLVLASARPPPLTLVESLARTVSSAIGAVRAVPVVTSELDHAVAEFRALGAPWLPATYQQNLPTDLGGLDRLLHSLADMEEAVSVLSLPVHWPGMPPVFDRIGNPFSPDEGQRELEMAETYTIESADDTVPIDPRLLRELRDILRTDEELDIGVRLKDRPPAPGEQGALPVALEIISTATPLGTAFAGVLMHWINTRKVRIKVRRGDESVELSTGNVKDAERLIAKLKT